MKGIDKDNIGWGKSRSTKAPVNHLKYTKELINKFKTLPIKERIG